MARREFIPKENVVDPHNLQLSLKVRTPIHPFCHLQLRNIRCAFLVFSSVDRLADALLSYFFPRPPENYFLNSCSRTCPRLATRLHSFPTACVLGRDPGIINDQSPCISDLIRENLTLRVFRSLNASPFIPKPLGPRHNLPVVDICTKPTLGGLATPFPMPTPCSWSSCRLRHFCCLRPWP